jgi:hypothetical protein
MKVAESSRRWLVRFDPGEELPRDLLALTASLGIETASVSGIGAVERAVIAYFDLAEKRYVETVLDEELEVVSLQGNLTLVAGSPFLHAHILLSRRDGQALAGHLMSARVSVTLEVFLDRFDASATRAMDPRWGLRLLDL